VPHGRRLDTRRTGENLPLPLCVKEGNPAHLDGRHQGRSFWHVTFAPHPHSTKFATVPGDFPEEQDRIRGPSMTARDYH